MPNRLVLLTIWLLYAVTGQASETILSYESHIDIQQDATIQTSETIVVKAEGNRIKHGLHRDFITDYSSPSGRRYRPGFKLLAVLRNDKPEPYRLQKLNTGLRIYLGDSTHYLEPGIHTYTLHYQSNRQIGFFGDHAEFYWHMDGSNWSLPILETRISLQLPNEIPENAIEIETHQNQSETTGNLIEQPSLTSLLFESINRLHPGKPIELTIKWPKRFITEPDSMTTIGYLVDDNLAALIALTGLGLMTIYYLLIWRNALTIEHRKDTPPLAPPAPSDSPATLRFIKQRDYDYKNFASAILNLAVKGHLNIEEGAKDRFVVSKKLSSAKPTLDERLLLHQLFSEARRFVELNPSNQATIKNALASHRLAILIDAEKHYIFDNAARLLPGTALMIATLVAMLLAITHRLHIHTPWPPFVFLLCWTPLTFAALSNAYKKGKRFLNQKQPPSLYATGFTFLCASSIGAGEYFGLRLLANQGLSELAAALVILTLINYGLYQALKTPSLLGRTLLNKTNRLRSYLAADDNRKDASALSGKHYEQLLPFAHALDAERPWTRRFITSAQASNSDENNQPRWYHSPHRHYQHYTDLTTTIGHNLSTAIEISLASYDAIPKTQNNRAK